MKHKKSILEGNIIYTLFAILIGFLTGAIILAIAGMNPGVIYAKLFTGIFAKPKFLAWSVVYATPLIFTGLSVAFSFRTGVFNIGAEGQFVVGSLAATVIGMFCPLPAIITVPLCLIAAAAAGAKFIVSPGFDPEIVDYCLKKGIPVYPGCVSPSEVAQAVKRGLKVVKFFPAEPAGGLPMIKAMAAPYVGLKFMPTGGINAKNLEEYLSCDKIICCGGSWMVKGDLVKAGEFDKIKELTAEARKLVDSIRK